MISSEWLKKYELAKKYYEKYGNLLVPASYSLKIDGQIVHLGTWINTQRMKYKGKMQKKLTEEQIRLLEEIEMIWEPKKNKPKKASFTWQEKYEFAKRYYEKYGNLLIPANYEQIIDGKIVKLGSWINNQRMRYKGKSSSQMPVQQKLLLEEIGMIWNVPIYNDMDKYLEEQYMLYEQGMLTEDQITKLLKDGVLVYSDDEKSEIQRGNTLKFYRKSMI